jgi:serine/threonine-protein kinase
MRYETMFAVPFDLDRLEVTGPRTVVVEDVAFGSSGAIGGFAISDNGILVYMQASVLNVESQLVWVDRDGTEEPLLEEFDRYIRPAISPDGSRVTFGLDQQGRQNIWVYDLTRAGVPTPVTRNEDLAGNAVWTSDGKRIIYYLQRGVSNDLFWRDWEASQPEELVLSVGRIMSPGAVSPDGRELAANVWGPGGDWDLWLVPLDGSGEPHVFRATEFQEYDPVFSPDGRWIAYESRESGNAEVWIQSYPDTSRARRRIATAGTHSPLWGNGGELFYITGNKWMAVQVDLETGRPGMPTQLFEGPYRASAGGLRQYDVTPDGQRFLMVKPRSDVTPPQLMVVVNWFEELKRPVPPGR